ncbi:hypothetical protein [Deefgea sp. CFH1-16]|uniref:hypothetical protein n=1 Tax=Deefgea sp. CFH1-16 TaxID=2675457 RepID=UPI0015F61102|nr:hypothetical protein [Deefgea sp. CFH1-16]MBM5574876.1 hypothetical protein [Deefgea sp. CFH1-16]
MLNKLIIYMFCMLIARLSLAADRSACDGLLKPMSEVLINSSVVLSTPPKSIFGFTVDWYLFQKGHFRKGKVRDETISYLKPFEGAIYRYSGGNDFPWENAVGPIAKRKRILTNYEGLKYPEFGPKEFIDFLDSVNGDATILIDLARKYNKSFTKDQILDSNLDYIDFYKKNASNCSEFSAGCRIKYFELGNEVDWEEGLKWSPIEYQSRIDGLIKKSKLITPKINFCNNWSNGTMGRETVRPIF